MNAISPKPLTEKMLPVSTTIPQGNGLYTLVAPDGQVYSCQENGTLEMRTPGSNGSFEQCSIQGDRVRFNPFGRGVYTFAFEVDVPNG